MQTYHDPIPVLKIVKENFLDLTSAPPGAALKPGRQIKLSAFWSYNVNYKFSLITSHKKRKKEIFFILKLTSGSRYP
jgi:hypothetical protein